MKWIRQKSTSELKEMKQELRQKPEDFEALLCLALILADESEDGRKESLQIFEKLQEMDVIPCGKVLALHIPLFLGMPGEARRASGRLLDSNELSHTWREWEYLAEYHAGRMEEVEFRLRAGAFGDLQNSFCHEIALEAFAVGDREKAKEYFEASFNTGHSATWFYHSAQMFLRRLEDPTWPSWIERKDGD